MQGDKKITNYNHLTDDNHISTGANILFTSSRLMLFVSSLLKPYKLTFQQFNVLRILRHSGSPIPIKFISDAMIDPCSNCSRLIDKLSKKGLALRLDPETDKRVVNVTITESGIKLVDSAAAQLFIQHKKKFDVFTEEDLTLLNSILDRLKIVINN